MATYFGELAALGAASVWVFSALFYSAAGKRVGAFTINRVRLAFAVMFVGTTHWVLFGEPFPTGAGTEHYLWLALSGVIGLVVGDLFLYQSYIMIGPRLGMLLFVLGPVFGSLLGWVFLGESMSLNEIGGMALVLAGVFWVVAERGAAAPGERQVPRRDYWIGIAFGAASMFCNAIQLVTAKRGLAGEFPPLSAVMIRETAALVFIWLWAALQGDALRTIRRARAERRATAAMFAGSFFGPFVGVWLSMAAVQVARVGPASTLMSMTPILSLPVVRFVLKERISPRAILGTLVAMSGVALMVLG